MFSLLTEQIIAFREVRGWSSYHTPENLAKSICIEAAELLECYQWGPDWPHGGNPHDEIADVGIYLLLLCHELNVNLEDLITAKLEKNSRKYPEEAR